VFPAGEPSLKALLLLALLDKAEESSDSWWSYQVLADTINSHQVIPTVEKDELDSLRVAMSDLKGALESGGQTYHLEVAKKGRSSLFRIVRRTDVRSVVAADAENVVLLIDPPIANPAEIASTLVQGTSLPGRA
jgi:hypothetical protein